jgi:hypothetical protein
LSVHSRGRGTRSVNPAAAHLIAAGAAPSPLDVASDPGLPVVKGQVA